MAPGTKKEKEAPSVEPGNLTQPRPNRGILFIVSTPIGNPEDITLRALRILQSVDVVAAEDARITRSLLSGLNISTKTVSLKARVDSDLRAELAGALLAGADMALVCDAGTPLLADPGAWLVKAALDLDCKVVSIPGAVAAIAALTAAGIDAQRFVFVGFPPRTKVDRSRFFSELATEARTIILYESRSHLRSTLKSLAASVRNVRKAALCRNLTKDNEETFRGTLGELIAYVGAAPLRGEYTVVIAGSRSQEISN